MEQNKEALAGTRVKQVVSPLATLVFAFASATPLVGCAAVAGVNRADDRSTVPSVEHSATKGNDEEVLDTTPNASEVKELNHR